MKTLTQQERAKNYAYKAYEKEAGTFDFSDIEEAYLAGDKDREAVEAEKREAGARGFEEFYKLDCHEGNDSHALMNYENHKATWQAARADRQELVACVLEMADMASGICTNPECECEAKATAKKHADLIAKLKAEKDTL